MSAYTLPVTSPSNVPLCAPANEVKYELRLGPVIVNVSPDTAVVIFVPPSILKVSLPSTAVPVESSPTNVIDPPLPKFSVLTHLSPLYFNI